jgi:hypothetical protein
MVRVKIYAEGGGEGELLDTLFRKGWANFFSAAGLERKMPKVIRGQGRDRTFNLFVTAVNDRGTGVLPLLLVDSEEAVGSGQSAWKHLAARDGWKQPADTTDDQVYLMVQVMETWFLADPNALGQFFGPDFRESVIKQWPALEAVDKNTVFQTLESATMNCETKQYAKGRISFELLAKVDPLKVEQKCPHAKALLEFLRSL